LKWNFGEQQSLRPSATPNTNGQGSPFAGGELLVILQESLHFNAIVLLLCLENHLELLYPSKKLLLKGNMP
jgi:hypothetical protein